jgi:hypothetical protein
MGHLLLRSSVRSSGLPWALPFGTAGSGGHARGEVAGGAGCGGDRHPTTTPPGHARRPHRPPLARETAGSPCRWERIVSIPTRLQSSARAATGVARRGSNVVRPVDPEQPTVLVDEMPVTALSDVGHPPCSLLACCCGSTGRGRFAAHAFAQDSSAPAHRGPAIGRRAP